MYVGQCGGDVSCLCLSASPPPPPWFGEPAVVLIGHVPYLKLREETGGNEGSKRRERGGER